MDHSEQEFLNPRMLKEDKPTTRFWLLLACVFLMALVFLKGRQLSKPYRHPLNATFAFMVVIWGFLYQILSRVEQRPIWLSWFFDPQAIVPGIPFNITHEIWNHNLTNRMKREVLKTTNVVTNVILPWNSQDNIVQIFLVLAGLYTVHLFWSGNQRFMAEISSATFDHKIKGDVKGNTAARNSALAREIAILINKLAAVLARHPVILWPWYRSRVRQLRGDIHRLLVVAHQRSPVPPHDALSSVLERSNVAWLLTMASEETRTMLREMSRDFSVLARGAIIDGLQKGGNLYTSPKNRSWVCELLLSASGPKLMMLKSIVDTTGDYHSLQKLIYADLPQGGTMQTTILDHFALDAIKQKAASRSTAPKVVKIVSDIDDTLYCSGGSFLAGVDRRYPKHVVYPGILQLFLELDTQFQSAQASLPEDQRTTLVDKFGNLTFLSARPHIYKDMSERVSYALFRRLLAEGRLHAMPTLVPGSLSVSGCAAIRTLCGGAKAWLGVGEQKYRSLLDLRKLYPEYRSVFFGDNGQGDVVAAELALQERPPLVDCAFIHQVQPMEASLTTLGHLGIEERRERWREMGVFFATSPVDFARIACLRGLIDHKALRRVCEAAVYDLEITAVQHPRFKGWSRRCEELNAHLQEAEAVLEGAREGPLGLARASSTPLEEVPALRVNMDWLEQELKDLRGQCEEEELTGRATGGREPFSLSVAIAGLACFFCFLAACKEFFIPDCRKFLGEQNSAGAYCDWLPSGLTTPAPAPAIIAL